MSHYLAPSGALTTTQGVSLNINTWYKIDVTLDWNASTISLWLNDKQIEASVPFFNGPSTNVAGVFLYNYDPTTVWIDELKLVQTEASWLHVPTK
jgi:hypothetical protein